MDTLYSTTVLEVSTPGTNGAQLVVHPRVGVDTSSVFFGDFSFYYHNKDFDRIPDISITSEEYFNEVFVPNFAAFAKSRSVFFGVYPDDEVDYGFDDEGIEQRLLMMDRSIIEDIVILLQECMEYGLVPFNDDLVSIDTEYGSV